MSFFQLSKNHARTIALIDIGSASVGGAYVRVAEGKIPTLYYTARVAVEKKEGEEIANSMLHSLAFLERLLMEEGAPALRRETGSGAVDEIRVSVAAPWQETSVISSRIQEDHDFTFTHAHLEAVLKKKPLSEGRVSSGETVIATLLNGYSVAKPFGKKAKRAELTILSSSIDKEVSEAIRSSLRKAFHTSEIRITSFAPAAYSVFCAQYPHQKDFIVLDVSGSGSDVLFVKHGLLADVQHVSESTPNMGYESTDTSAWLSALRTVFATFAENRGLPHTVFLLADEGVRDDIKRIIEENDLKALWRTGSELSLIALAPSAFASGVQAKGKAGADLFLSLLAISAGQ